ncbi:MAG: IS66 family insertion sequence element accessory protein TnpB [Armatimonadetes bacterium]|nr:IS66 family insertion sequence element accessory protein TnpB [Armatimonadota bacterium]
MTAREELSQEWRERLEDFAQSEMTVQAWCDFNRVSLHQYYYWRRRLKASETNHATNGSWMSVSVVDTPPIPTTPNRVTLRIAGAEIEVTPDFDPRLLRAVVQALAVEPC